MRSSIVKIGFASFWIDNIMPVLLVECDLHVSFHWATDCWHIPGPFINMELFRWNFNFLCDWSLSIWVDDSDPKSIIEMWSSKHVSKTLMSLEIGTIGWSPGRVVE